MLPVRCGADSGMPREVVKILGRVAVFPVIPQRLSRLHELAFNLWWSWHPEAQALYSSLDPALWQALNHNTVKFLSEVDPAKLNAAAADSAYIEKYDGVLADFDAYMNAKDTWFATTHPDLMDQTIAYFSLEFGLHESLPIYSGGLGILAGDHCKAASDLGLPFVGMGFLYPQGYFEQRINRQGVQEASYDKLNFAEVPATAAVNDKGEEITISVDLPGRKVYAKVWKFAVGRINLYLMDTDVALNRPEDRELAARLYGGNQELRITQEIVLGIGGVRALRALGYDPQVFHMNEGHAAFLGLERVRELVQEKGLSFADAKEAVAASGVFTTHTPVPAGNDAFAFDLMDRFFGDFWPQLGLNRDEFLNFARQDQSWGPSYSMTVLALALSSQHNGVAKLHGEVARKMWAWLWPGVDTDEVPITSVTNGIHTQTWLSPEMKALFDKHLGADWITRLDDPQTWQPLARVPDAELWQTHQRNKLRLIEFARERVRAHRLELGEGTYSLKEAASILKPDALTIGFARRFATYKRATLLFRYPERLIKLINDEKRPVQFLFSGKAHPADEPGKSFIQKVYQFSREQGFEGKVIFLENYDMNTARYLVAGVDVWLNTPIRPYEASGTSGMKASLNGAPNASILDGWWPEAYDGKNGWAIGEAREYQNQETQDEADALSLYDILENEIIPAYYDQDAQGVSATWVSLMKEAIRTVAPVFSTQRMVKEYTNNLYIPADRHGDELKADDFKEARDLSAWKRNVYEKWPGVSLEASAPRRHADQLG